MGRVRGPSRADQGEIAADPPGVLHGAAAASQGAVHESGGAAAVGAVVPASARPIAAGGQTAHRMPAGGVGGIDAQELEAKLGWLREYRQAVEEWSQWHEVIQVVVRQVRRHGIDRDTVAELRRQLGR